METIFVEGLYYKEPNEKSPDFVLAKLSAKREELIKFLEKQEGDWVNMEALKSKAGKPYIKLIIYTNKIKGDLPF